MSTSIRILFVGLDDEATRILAKALEQHGFSIQYDCVDPDPTMQLTARLGPWDVVVCHEQNTCSPGPCKVIADLLDEQSATPLVYVTEAPKSMAMQGGAEKPRQLRVDDFVASVAKIVSTARSALQAGESLEARSDEFLPAAAHRLQRAHAELLEFARTRSFQGKNLKSDLADVTELAARSLDVERVGVWLFDENRQKICCIEQFEASTGRHSEGDTLRVSTHPTYFKAISELRLIVAHDALSHPHTREYADHYLRPHAITSMMDSAVRLRGENVGVICLEHKGAPRRWTTEEEILACTFSELVSLALEASQRQSAEVALRESELQFREIFHAMSDPVILVDATSPGSLTIVAANGAGEEVLAVTSAAAVGKKLDEAMAPDLAQRIEARLRTCVDTRAPISCEQEVQRPSGSRWFHFVFVPIRNVEGRISRVAIVARDLTLIKRAEEERRRLEADLLQTLKMQSLGALASGIAHDFNSFLTAIRGYSEMLQFEIDPASCAKTYLDGIVSASDRAKELVAKILTFSRKEPPKRTVVSFAEIVEEAVRFVSVGSKRTIAIKVTVPLEDTSVLGDPIQLHQIVMNLCTNAMQSIAGKEGVVTVDLRTVSLAGPTYQGDDVSALPTGVYAVLAVSDTGEGIAREDLPRVFEPFFTTKSAAEGTGLGLAVVRNLVEQHGGLVAVSSSEGKGSTFRVYLPIAESPAAKAAKATRETEGGQGQAVLFVDDDPELLRLAVLQLRRLGYTPIAYTDPIEALAAFRAEPGRFAAMIADYSMPHLSGINLIEQVRTLRADLPILLATGLGGSFDEVQAAGIDLSNVLIKPFGIRTLASALRVAMSRPGSGNSAKLSPV